MEDRMVIGVVLPEGYTSGSDFAKDCNVEVLGHCTESLFKTLKRPNVDALVNRFLAWQLPQSVCSDLCVTDREYKFPRSGTCLLSAAEAKQMIEHLFAAPEST